MEPDMEASSEQPKTSPTNPRSSKYNLRHNPKPICNEYYKYWTASWTVCSTERARRRSRNSRNAPRGTYVAV